MQILEETQSPDEGGNEVLYVKAGQDKCRDMHLEFADLAPGAYYVYVEIDLPDGQDSIDFAVTCYGASDSYFEPINCSLGKKEMIEKVCKSIAFNEMEGVEIKDYGDDQAPAIKKYNQHTPAGYGFIIYRNDEDEAVLEEKVQYPKFEGLEIVGSEQDQGYEVSVGPGEVRVIILRSDYFGYGYSSSYTNQVIHGDKHIKKMCLEKGEKETRPDPSTGEECGINIYSYNHGSGFCFLYVNSSENWIYTENLSLELQNLQVDGMEG